MVIRLNAREIHERWPFQFRRMFLHLDALAAASDSLGACNFGELPAFDNFPVRAVKLRQHTAFFLVLCLSANEHIVVVANM